ncbi:sensor histidine kinase [Agromyces sp. SYSU T00266]|uniref:sensor histidine kinase n=1 Tax=Agromyces zhanjiangensis TaxID=3158562 RepID=UPI0033938E3A
MTLGLPEHLAKASLSRALASAGHAAGAVCLASAMVIAIASIVVEPVGEIGPDRQAAVAAFALLAVQAALFALVAFHPSVTLTVAYLLGGTAVVYGLTVLVMAPGNGFETTNNALLAMPRTALLLVGGAGIGSRIAIAWAALGWGLGEAAAFLGATVAGAAWAPSAAATAALGIVVLTRAFDAMTRSDARRETALHRASQKTRELVIRHDYELRAIARLHDTALSHLIAIAASGSGPVDERLRTAISHDLSLIVGRDWAMEHSEDAGDGSGAGARSTSAVPAAANAVGPAAAREISNGGPSRAGGAGRPGPASTAAGAGAPPPLADAIGMARDAGLAVNVSGAPDVLAAVGPRRRAAIEAAVAQCLMNVARHAGVDDVEVALGRADGEVTVVVVDDGRGFDPERVPDDRIGLRTSIRGRIEQEGGRARIWSRPGVGTTVMLAVPEGGE